MDWLSIIEYSNKSRKSISTIRRMIKKNEIEYKLENGRYLLFAKDIEQKYSSEFQLLNKKIMKLHEEVSDLKMLLNIYEGQKRDDQRESPPEIPY